jgi:hypothetical protein
MGPLWREMLISRAFLYISFKVPIKDPPLRIPSQNFDREGGERERDAPVPKSSICVSRVPGK